MKTQLTTIQKFISGSVLLLAGCGIYESKVQPRGLNEINSLLNQKSKLSFSQVNATIIQPNCTRCHRSGRAGGGVLLDTYENVKANLDDVRDVTLVEKTMPKDAGPLPADQLTVLQRWIDQGAPNESVTPDPGQTPNPDPTATPTVVPSPTPAQSATPALNATYANIRDQIFLPKCLKCHSAGGSQPDFPLDNYAKMIAQGELIMPGKPEGSTVVQQIEKGKMPTKRSGLPPVTAEELAAIKTWILNGAKP